MRNNLGTPKSPNIPGAPLTYVSSSFNIISDVLRLYFNRLDSAFQSLLGAQGGKFIAFPYASFYSTQDQTAGGVDTPTQVTFDSTAFSNGIAVASNTVSFDQPGIYSVTYNLQFNNADPAAIVATVWLMSNSVDLANTASVYSVSPGFTNIAGQYYVELGPTDTLELWWAVADVSATLYHDAASAVPFDRPAVSSADMSITFVSNTTA
jgi:hypothetical protein